MNTKMFGFENDNRVSQKSNLENRGVDFLLLPMNALI